MRCLWWRHWLNMQNIRKVRQGWCMSDWMQDLIRYSMQIKLKDWMNTFLLILRTKKTKIRCKVVISMVFNENQELDYIFWNNVYSFLNIVIHFALRLGNFISVIYTSVFGVYVAICLINGSHFYVRILKIQ